MKPASTGARGRLIALDWGTSNLRAFLLDGRGRVIDNVNAPRGVATLNGAQQFEQAFRHLLAVWLCANADIPVLIAGMVGSFEGWVDTGYIACPAALENIVAALVPVSALAPLTAAIVPGLKCRSVAGHADVMRGEETQMAGVLSDNENRDGLWCLPGTHSKWVQVADGCVTTFSTCLTGDAFAALHKHSILARFGDDAARDDFAFDRGVAGAERAGGLLHHLFSARAEVLVGDLARPQVASYLSGLLIGAEVKNMLSAYGSHTAVGLVGTRELTRLYARACAHFGCTAFAFDGERAAVAGLRTIASRAGLAHFEAAA